MGKRLFDLAAAGLGLVLLAPVMALIALAVKLDSPGPVFFRQQRVGRYGQPFRIHKFRTMQHRPADAGRQITVGADPRITRVGALLRSSKLDELPQLIDVLLGHMSLVGPRPEVPRYLAYYPPAVREQVLSVRPGITDLASIEYRRESELLAASSDPERTYVEEVLPAKLRYAQQYVEQAGFWTDLRLLARTLFVIVTR
ncbi:sugar transferase [Caldimonas brevitalea]|uniref:Sugar transferase n=1 Tax=Caldimonas brevitalea TaxID=413882 RepID=A0A0G3BP42_9BURK|nr:sugar transferase [Caldimonas brevitalea]AKJ31177.1 sugar transferase [Caldimonas brevitalea]